MQAKVELPLRIQCTLLIPKGNPHFWVRFHLRNGKLQYNIFCSWVLDTLFDFQPRKLELLKRMVVGSRAIITELSVLLSHVCGQRLATSFLYQISVYN